MWSRRSLYFPSCLERRRSACAIAPPLVLALCLAGGAPAARAGEAMGHARRENVLLGMHFLHGNLDCNARTGGKEDVIPGFWDYVRFMPEDLEHISYADFWHWWYEFERYKGDEKGLEEMDAIVDGCLARGMKVKIDLAWSTWWTEDLDWSSETKLAFGPPDLDDWAHLCGLLGRRFRGRVAVWHLQGEANDLEHYWRGKPIEFVQEVYRIGSRVFKEADPEALISISGASPSVPREALDAWVRANVGALKGLFDDVPMNYFADVADPYGGLASYYRSIRSILDEHGERDVEVGSGESSFQWAETSYDLPRDPPRSIEGLDPARLPLCELKQAWRFNDAMGTFFEAGGNKFVLWGTEYAPGGGWPWRWGFRKYQDWWGTWPQSSKVPGTNIVYGFEPPDGRKVDLRSGWSSRETDPFHPIWPVYRFWSRATPPGAEAVRVPARVVGGKEGARVCATYLQTRDTCAVLLQGGPPGPRELEIDLGRTGWEEGDALRAELISESIELGTGKVTAQLKLTLEARLEGGAARIPLPALEGFTSLTLSRPAPRLAAEVLLARVTEPPVMDRPIEGIVVLRNKGSAEWRKGRVIVSIASGEGVGQAAPVASISADVKPGEVVPVTLRLPAPSAEGRTDFPLRLREEGGHPFGPLIIVPARTVDSEAPRKLVAHRGERRIKVQWFAPRGGAAVKSYELFRIGAGDPAGRTIPVEGTEYIDGDVEPGRSYRYRVAAIDEHGRRSRPSNDDNARTASRPRLFDAEVISHTVPSEVVLGERAGIEVTLKNTGTKAWSLEGGPNDLRLRWTATRLWGEGDETRLPDIPLGGSREVKPGETVTIGYPFVGPREGRFENHWILTLQPAGKPRAYFGTPLLVETLVRSR